MTLIELLDHLDHHDCTLRATTTRLHLLGPGRVRKDPEVLAALKENKLLLIWHVYSRRTGHSLGFCTKCSLASLVYYDPSAKFPRCRMTPKCEGRHEPREADRKLLKRLKPPERETVPRTPATPDRSRLFGPWPPFPDREAA
jgi:hypothetical protein